MLISGNASENIAVVQFALLYILFLQGKLKHELIGQTEMTKTDRLRARRLKKKRQHEKRLKQEKKEKVNKLKEEKSSNKPSSNVKKSSSRAGVEKIKKKKFGAVLNEVCVDLLLVKICIFNFIVWCVNCAMFSLFSLC